MLQAETLEGEMIVLSSLRGGVFVGNWKIFRLPAMESTELLIRTCECSREIT